MQQAGLLSAEMVISNRLIYYLEDAIEEVNRRPSGLNPRVVRLVLAL